MELRVRTIVSRTWNWVSRNIPNKPKAARPAVTPKKIGAADGSRNPARQVVSHRSSRPSSSLGSKSSALVPPQAPCVKECEGDPGGTHDIHHDGLHRVREPVDSPRRRYARRRSVRRHLHFGGVWLDPDGSLRTLPDRASAGHGEWVCPGRRRWALFSSPALPFSSSPSPESVK